MAYSSAGHEHILICRASARGQVEAIVSGGFMLGMLPDIGGYLEEKQIKLDQKLFSPQYFDLVYDHDGYRVFDVK